MKFGTEALEVAYLSDFGEFCPLFRGAQILDRVYLGHFLADRHKILHGYGYDQWTFLPEFGEL